MFVKPFPHFALESLTVAAIVSNTTAIVLREFFLRLDLLKSKSRNIKAQNDGIQSAPLKDKAPSTEHIPKRTHKPSSVKAKRRS